jgi:hypothetical protein
MSERKISMGNCFICGTGLGKIKMKNHIIKDHTLPQGGEQAVFVKVEGLYDNNYWLLLDIAANAVLGDLDSFFRKIWLECCDHMSVFGRKKFDGMEFYMKKR